MLACNVVKEGGFRVSSVNFRPGDGRAIEDWDGWCCRRPGDISMMLNQHHHQSLEWACLPLPWAGLKSSC